MSGPALNFYKTLQFGVAAAAPIFRQPQPAATNNEQLKVFNKINLNFGQQACHQIAGVKLAPT
jgi:hypothetical protein